MVDFKAAINRGIDRKPAKQWPMYTGGYFDRTAVVTASEIGYCARKVKLDKIALIESGSGVGVTKTASNEDWGHWERGHAVEAWAVDHLHRGWESDWRLEYTGDNQVSFAYHHQGGTPDGILFSDTEVACIDIKSIDPRTNVSRLPKKEHVDQVIQNTDLVAWTTELSPTRGYLLYIDASNYKLMYQFAVDFDPAHADKLADRAELILETEPWDLPAEGIYKGHCSYCAHKAVCSEMMRNEGSENGKAEELGKAAGVVFG